jgi:hypothetical protein
MKRSGHSRGRHLDLALLSGLFAMGEQSRETYRIWTLRLFSQAFWYMHSIQRLRARLAPTLEKGIMVC